MIRRDDDEHRARITERLKDFSTLEAALKKAARGAVQEHARAGQPIPVWRNDQVVWEVPRLDEEDEGKGR
jgi:hypothetical protein